MKNEIVLLHGMFCQDFYKSLKQSDNIFVLEARPYLDGAKKTCKDLLKTKIKPTLIADNMAGFLFYKGLVKEVYVSSQIQDQNGALCPIGSLILGVLAKKHNVPLRVVEHKDKVKLMGKQSDIFSFNGKKAATSGIDGYVPLVEWLDREYIKS